MSASGTILIAGVGNLLLTDDGVGIHAIQELQRNPIPGVTMVEIGTAILHGLSYAEEATRILVIDAARGGRPPGTIYLFDATERTETQTMTSLHAMGLREAVRRLSRNAPPPITVLGVEPLTLDYGMELSPPVREALPQVISLARETVEGWMSGEIRITQTAAQGELAFV